VLVNESPYINQAVALGSGQDFVAALVYPDIKRASAAGRSSTRSTPVLLRRARGTRAVRRRVAAGQPLIEISTSARPPGDPGRSRADAGERRADAVGQAGAKPCSPASSGRVDSLLLAARREVIDVQQESPKAAL
jgi:hypothetical protein